jgi:protein-serine/threonine kinase
MRCRSQREQAHSKYQSESLDQPQIANRTNTITSLCKHVIRKLLVKDETKRLGSRGGASDIKNHAFFKTTSWALLRHSKPPIIPQGGRGIDTLNFRNVKESQSVDISAAKAKGVPLDSGLKTPGEEAPDPFEEFNSVTLHHDGDDHHHQHDRDGGR